MAAAVAAAAMPSVGQASQTTGSATPGFDTLTLDYASFCALPESQRVYYALVAEKIIKEKLDNASWKPTEWGDAPKLPVPGGSWDGVPMDSPIPNLAGSGPYKPTWDSLLEYDAPEWYQDAKFGIWAHWNPQCVPEAGAGTHATCIWRVRNSTDIMKSTMEVFPDSATRTSALSGSCSIGSRMS